MSNTEPAALVVEPLEPGRFRVTGGHVPHIVDLRAPVASCDCADHRYRRRDCKHILAVDRHLAQDS